MQERVKSRRHAKVRGQMKRFRNKTRRQQGGSTLNPMVYMSKKMNERRERIAEEKAIKSGDGAKKTKTDNTRLSNRKMYNYNPDTDDHGMNALLKAYHWLPRDENRLSKNTEDYTIIAFKKLVCGIAIIRTLRSKLGRFEFKGSEELLKKITIMFKNIEGNRSAITENSNEYNRGKMSSRSGARRQNAYGYQAELCYRILGKQYPMKANGIDDRISRAERHIELGNGNFGTVRMHTIQEHVCKPLYGTKDLTENGPNRYIPTNNYMRSIVCTTLMSPEFDLTSKQLRQIQRVLGEENRNEKVEEVVKVLYAVLNADVDVIKGEFPHPDFNSDTPSFLKEYTFDDLKNLPEYKDIKTGQRRRTTNGEQVSGQSRQAEGEQQLTTLLTDKPHTDGTITENTTPPRPDDSTSRQIVRYTSPNEQAQQSSEVTNEEGGEID